MREAREHEFRAAVSAAERVGAELGRALNGDETG
jgi:hypothetical protein